MMSETAYFVKDVVGPKGCVSITERDGERKDGSADVDSHTATNSLKVHWQERDADDEFTRPDEWIDTTDEPDHDGLCLREQEFLLDAIQNDVDLTGHIDDAVNSLRIVLAADQSAADDRRSLSFEAGVRRADRFRSNRAALIGARLDHGRTSPSTVRRAFRPRALLEGDAGREREVGGRAASGDVAVQAWKCRVSPGRRGPCPFPGGWRRA